jgi:hypothetical protein
MKHKEKQSRRESEKFISRSIEWIEIKENEMS